MNEIELISRLATLAHGDKGDPSAGAMPADISGGVLASIRAGEPPLGNRSWIAVASVGCVLAILCVSGAMQSWSSFSNPLIELQFDHTSAPLP